ncbi:MAG: DUF5333 domain-containing protein [Roseobacter sp.]
MSVALAQGALAQSGLRDERDLDEGLYVIGLAQEIKKKCPDIASRKFQRTLEVLKLRNRALQLGYTEDEIRAHVKSDAEKARLRERAAEYMKSKGLTQNRDGYCALGRLEMEKKSSVGALLRPDD